MERRDKYLAAGRALVEKKDFARAILAFKNAAQAMPNDAEVYYHPDRAREPHKWRVALVCHKVAFLERSGRVRGLRYVFGEGARWIERRD
jgi:hypothetical protein